MVSRNIIIGTRGSELALRQTRLVASALTAKTPGLQIETVIITTAGDKFQGPIPERVVGKAWFTAEIEAALGDRRIDLAIHSLKDMPLEIADELTVATALTREDPRDVLISKTGVTLDKLPAGSVIGTDSSRRQAQILHNRPDLVVKSIRGNVDTRLRKLREEDYDAIIIAAAGLARLGRSDEITQFLDPTDFVPAIGQGALAAETRTDDESLQALLNLIRDRDTQICAMAERSFSLVIGGGCKLPIGCHATITDATINLIGMIGTSDGHKLVKETASGRVEDATKLAEELARTVMGKADFSLTQEH